MRYLAKLFLLVLGMHSVANATYAEGNPLGYTDPEGLAVIEVPKFNNFSEEVRWRQKYKDLFVVNNAMRKQLEKECPQLLDKFDSWVLYLDKNIENQGLRERGMYARGKYSEQRTQFNKSFFLIERGDGSPAQTVVFGHEFRHMMKANRMLVRPGDEVRDPKVVPAEIDAEKWSIDFWRGQCTCER